MGRKSEADRIRNTINLYEESCELSETKLDLLKKINNYYLKLIKGDKFKTTPTYDDFQRSKSSSFFDDKTSNIQQNIVSVAASVSQELKQFNTDGNEIDKFLENFSEELLEKEAVIFDISNDELNVKENNESNDVSFDDKIPIDQEITFNLVDLLNINENSENYYFDNNFNLESLLNEDFGYQKQVTNYPQSNQVSSSNKCFNDLNIENLNLNKSAFHVLLVNDNNNIITNNLKKIAADVDASFGDNLSVSNEVTIYTTDDQLNSSNPLLEIYIDNNDMNYLTPNTFEQSGNEYDMDCLNDDLDYVSRVTQDEHVANIERMLKEIVDLQY